jgi:hypothetical protein
MSCCVRRRAWNTLQRQALDTTLAVIAIVPSSVACGPSTTAPDGVCGAALAPPENSCANEDADPGELCPTATVLEVDGADAYFFLLDADGDSFEDLLLPRSLAPTRLLLGRGDGSFDAPVDVSIPSGMYIQAPRGLAYDILGVTEAKGEVELVGIASMESGDFTSSVLASWSAVDAVAVSIGAGHVDELGAARVFVGVEQVESGGEIEVRRYALVGATATDLVSDAAVAGHPGFAAAQSEDIWIADFDEDGFEDYLVTQAKREFSQSDGESWVRRGLDGDGAFFNHLRWLAEHDAVTCSALDAFNFVRPLSIENVGEPEGEFGRGLVVARLNADEALDLVFSTSEGTFVALGSLAEATEPAVRDPAATGWPDIEVGDQAFQHIAQISDTQWTRAKAADLDDDGTLDLVGSTGDALELVLGGR